MANDALKDFISSIMAQVSTGGNVSSGGYSDEYKTVMTDLAVALSRVASAKEAEASADFKFKSLTADFVDSVTSAFGADSELGRAATLFFGAAKTKASAVVTAVTSDELGDKLGAVVDSVTESARSKASSLASAVTAENPDGVLSSIISTVAAKLKPASPAPQSTAAAISDMIDSIASSMPSAKQKPSVSDNQAAVGEFLKTLGGAASVGSTPKPMPPHRPATARPVTLDAAPRKVAPMRPSPSAPALVMTETSYRSALSKALDSISSGSSASSGAGGSEATTVTGRGSGASAPYPTVSVKPKAVPNPPTREITAEEKRVQATSKLISGCYGICFAHDHSQDKPTVISAGENGVWASLVNWSDVVEITAGRCFTVAVKANGVLYVEARDSESFVKGNEIYSWTGIKALAAGENHLVALKSDGKVIAAGDNSFGQCNVSDFSSVRAIAASKTHTVALKENGTVRAVGNESSGCCETIYWEDISQVSAGDGFTVGLRGDGTAVCTKSGSRPRYDLSEFRDIVAVSAGNSHVVMLRKDGKVVAVGENKEACAVSKWENIIAVSAGDSFTVALAADGRILFTGTLPGSTAGWKILHDESDLEGILSKREALVSASFSKTNQRTLLISRKTMEIEELSVERAQLGLFDGGAKKRIDTRIAQLKREIAELNG